MEKTLASQIMDAAVALGGQVSKLDTHISLIEDASEKKEFTEALGNILRTITFDIVFRIMRQYPELDPDKGSLAIVRTSPPNALILIMDSAGGVPPELMKGKLVAATESCVAVGCKHEDHGETQIVLGRIDEIGSGDEFLFSGTLETPSLKLVVRSVMGADLAELPVFSTRSTVRIWVNDATEPDRIVIGFA